MNNVKYVDFETLERFMKRTLQSAGVPEKDAEIIADVLIQADKLGIDSHGINRLKPIYIDRINQGILNPITEIELVKESPTTAIFDGHNGMGHVVAKHAMETAIQKAKIYGMGMSAVRNSTHYGIAGYYALMATKENMIGITGTNARPSIAPTFGVDNMMGTNPLTFGIPTDEEFPFFLDCATSVTQRGKIEYYARNNMDTPNGLVIDRQGNEMTDSPQILKALVDGEAALLALGGSGEDTGGYKGYGYAAVVEILSAALAGGSFMKMLTGFDSEGNRIPYPLGHFFIAIDTDHFIGEKEFKKISGRIVKELRNSTVAPGAERIYTAGEKEHLTYLKRKVEGVPIGAELQKEIKELMKTYHMDDCGFPF
ncbi:Ldh family oxidoreductase [Clostridia bacterium]|nr:Ldh family oxidoreductase [Clostridia bacterium]